MKKYVFILFFSMLFFSSVLFAAKTAKDIPKEYKDRFTKAEKLMDNGQYKEALSIFEELIVDLPKNISVMYNYSILLAKLKRYDESSVILDDLIELDTENDLSILNTRGWVSIMAGKYEQSLEYFNKALSDSKYKNLSSSLKMKLHNNSGISYWQLDQYDEAAEQFQLAKKLGSQIADMNLKIVESILDTMNSKDINIPGVFVPVVGSAKYDFNIEKQKNRIIKKLGIEASSIEIFVSSNGTYVIAQGSGLSYPMARKIVLSAKEKGISDAFVASMLNLNPYNPDNSSDNTSESEYNDK